VAAYTIRELTTDADIAQAFPVMLQLRTTLADAHGFVRAVQRQRASGYRLIAACVGAKRIVGLAGWRFGESLMWGRHVYVDDLVTDEDARSSGAGRAMLNWLKAQGREAGCRELHLDSGVQRTRAHAFYEREGMERTSHHFRIVL
jgi:GNAT superfamily N-acetyltransferase